MSLLGNLRDRNYVRLVCNCVTRIQTCRCWATYAIEIMLGKCDEVTQGTICRKIVGQSSEQIVPHRVFVGTFESCCNGIQYFTCYGHDSILAMQKKNLNKLKELQICIHHSRNFVCGGSVRAGFNFMHLRQRLKVGITASSSQLIFWLRSLDLGRKAKIWAVGQGAGRKVGRQPKGHAY